MLQVKVNVSVGSVNAPLTTRAQRVSVPQRQVCVRINLESFVAVTETVAVTTVSVTKASGEPPAMSSPMHAQNISECLFFFQYFI